MRPPHFIAWKIALLPFLLTIFLLINGCSDNRPIKIAFIGAVSGKQSEVGISVRNAVMMKVESVNRQGGINGRKIQLEIYDNKGDTSQCSEQFSNILAEKIEFVIGPIFSQMAEATLNSIQGKNILVLSPTMSTSYLSGRDDNFLRIAPSTEGQAVKISEYVIAKKYNKVGVIYDLSNEKYTLPLYSKFKELVEKEGIEIVSEIAKGQNDNRDLHNSALTLHATEPDCILMCLSALDGANLAQQLRKVGSNASFIGVSWTQTNDLLEHGGRAVENMVLVSMPEKAEHSQGHQDFDKRYREKFNAPPSFAAFLGFDAISTLLLGMQKVQSITPEGVKESILNLGEIEGIAETITMNSFGDIEGHYDLVQVQQNAFNYLEF